MNRLQFAASARGRWSAARAAYRLAQREREDYDRDHLAPAARRRDELNDCKAAIEQHDLALAHSAGLARSERAAALWLLKAPGPDPAAIAEKIDLLGALLAALDQAEIRTALSALKVDVLGLGRARRAR